MCITCLSALQRFFQQQQLPAPLWHSHRLQVGRKVLLEPG